MQNCLHSFFEIAKKHFEGESWFQAKPRSQAELIPGSTWIDSNISLGSWNSGFDISIWSNTKLKSVFFRCMLLSSPLIELDIAVHKTLEEFFSLKIPTEP